MSKIQRIRSFLAGIIMLFCAFIMVVDPETGYPLIIIILSISLLVSGVKALIYYFTMARFMVGGKASLYSGIILFDLGVFTMALTDIPDTYIIIYLVVVKLFAGAVDILSATDARKTGAPSWRMKLTAGILNVLIAFACGIFGKNHTVGVYIYVSGLAYSAIFKIIAAFRKTAIVYVN